MTSIAVSRLPQDTGECGWNALLSPPSPPQTLVGNQTFDWLVIGAGFAGLSAARRLHQLCPDATIAIVDASRVGAGPAGRNSGFMIDLPHDVASENYGGSIATDAQQIQLNRAAIEFAQECAQEYELPSEAFARTGKVNAAASAKGIKHNRQYAAHLDVLGEPYRFMDATDMQSLTGSRYYLGGLYTPGTAIIQPAMYVRGLADGLNRAPSVNLFECSPVTSLRRTQGIWHAQTTNGSASAPKVILGVNGHLASFGFHRRALVHITLYASMTRALSESEIAELGGEHNWGLTPSDPLGSTVRRTSGTGGTRILIRNRATYDPSMTIKDHQVESAGSTHDRSFVKRFPSLAKVEMEYRWSGRLCLSLNNVGAFGEVEEGLFSACCQNGLGTTRGTIAGALAAELANGQVSELTHTLASEPAPQTLPPEPFATLGARASIRWGEFRAGAEL
jgi:glycine/D-amino acid oxidase-like deaminating enzyme